MALYADALRDDASDQQKITSYAERIECVGVDLTQLITSAGTLARVATHLPDRQTIDLASLMTNVGVFQHSHCSEEVVAVVADPPLLALAVRALSNMPSQSVSVYAQCVLHERTVDIQLRPSDDPEEGRINRSETQHPLIAEAMKVALDYCAELLHGKIQQGGDALVELHLTLPRHIQD